MMAARIIATFGYVGYIRPAPGTWGSLAAVIAGYAAYPLIGALGLTVFTALILPLGWWATKTYTAGSADHDPKEVVVDELWGQWIALMPVFWGAAMTGAPASALWPGWISAFILFRLFDITKWGPIGWADRRNDAVGVMLDDGIAGLFAAIGVVILAAIAHGVMFL